MPGGNGMGPSGQGPGTGRGMGRGGGRGRLGGNSPGSGPGGICVCPKCNLSVPHNVGTPCYSVSCPKCGTAMIKG
jgi:uncharacterized protein